MEYIRPSYYEKFCCIAGECEDTCCAGWQIGIDDKSIKVYEQVAGGFGNRLHNCIDRDECTFERDYESGRCAFLNEKNLCDIYGEIGPEYLCATCRDFPRHTEEYEGIREESLSLACPVAAALILSQTESINFLSTTDETEDDDWEFDFLLFTKLMDARVLIFDMLQSTKYSLTEKMSLLYDYGRKLQELLDVDELFRMDELTTHFQDRKPEAFQSYPEDIRDLFTMLRGFEFLKPEWPVWLDECEEILAQHTMESFHDFMRHSNSLINIDMEQIGQQLMVYFTFLYFGSSVYDDDVLTKVKIILAGTQIICSMCYGRWLLQNQKLTFHDVTQIAWRFSKEVEHSDINLEKLEDYLSSWGGCI